MLIEVLNVLGTAPTELWIILLSVVCHSDAELTTFRIRQCNCNPLQLGPFDGGSLSIKEVIFLPATDGDRLFLRNNLNPHVWLPNFAPKLSIVVELVNRQPLAPCLTARRPPPAYSCSTPGQKARETIQPGTQMPHQM